MSNKTLVLAYNRQEFQQYASTVLMERVEYVDSPFRLRGYDNFKLVVVDGAERRDDYKEILELARTRRNVVVEHTGQL